MNLFEKLLQLAKETTRNGKPATQDPVIRDRLITLEGYVQSHLYSNYRQLSMAAAKQEPGYVSMMNKLINTNIGHEVAAIAKDLLAENLLQMPATQGRATGSEKWLNRLMGSLGIAIAGGTSNIQRNIIAERGLGLPRDAAQ